MDITPVTGPTKSIIRYRKRKTPSRYPLNCNYLRWYMKHLTVIS